MNDLKMRSDFDVWLAQQGMSDAVEDGLYRSHIVGWMWRAWQASRAALVEALKDELQ